MTLGEQEGGGVPDLLPALLKGKLPPEGDRGATPDPLPLILRGFMPALLTLPSPEATLAWWQGYVATYLERDLRALSQVSSLTDYRRVMELAALRTGQLANQSEISRDAAVSQPTVHRYLNLLEASYLLLRLPAFSGGRTTRLVKSPKAYWADPALAAHLMGHYNLESLRGSREEGFLFENLVLLHLQVLADLLTPPARLFHWRTAAGAEVDFVLEWGRTLLAFEVKLTETPRYSDAKELERFLAAYPHCRAGVLLHRGSQVPPLGERVVALSWSLLETSARSHR